MRIRGCIFGCILAALNHALVLAQAVAQCRVHGVVTDSIWGIGSGAVIKGVPRYAQELESVCGADAESFREKTPFRAPSSFGCRRIGTRASGMCRPPLRAPGASDCPRGSQPMKLG